MQKSQDAIRAVREALCEAITQTGNGRRSGGGGPIGAVLPTSPCCGLLRLGNHDVRMDLRMMIERLRKESSPSREALTPRRLRSPKSRLKALIATLLKMAQAYPGED